MLRLIQSSYLRFDPIYSLFRREALAGTALHRMTMGADQVLAAELSLVGPWTHVPRCLSHRARVEEEADVIARKTLPPDQDAFDLTPAYRREVFRQVIREAGLDRYQRAHCEAAAHRYYLRQTLRERKRRARRRFRAARRRVLGRLAEATDR